MMEENKKIRIFIGIDLPSYVKEKILKIQRHLASTSNKIKWVQKNNLHITLKFLGYIEPNTIELISNKLKKTISKKSNFKITLSKIGAFPKINYPKIIWVGIENEIEKMQNLFKDIDKSLYQLGFNKEKRKFHSHITIGRVKNLQKKSELVELLTKVEYPQQVVNIENVILYKSVLNTKGPIYTKLNKYKLGD